MLATIFISVPFVVREVTPVLEEVGDEQEQAASTLGASRWQAFWRITLPSIRWGIAYGVVLSVARCIGEFGAVSVVSGKISGETETLTLLVEKRFQNFDLAGAYAASALLAFIALGDAARDDEDQPTEGRRMIAVRDVTKSFGDFVALDGVSLEIPDGSLTALLGPSGSGKSTLLRIIAGLEQPDSGVVEIHGADATRVPPQRRGIGFVFQHYAAFKHMTVRDNVAFGLKIRKQPKDAHRASASTSCSASSGSPATTSATRTSSPGGQRQRMALARALAVEPKVLLLDEPFGALDAKVRAELREWLRRLHDEVHVTTVLVTHDQEEAMAISDHIAVMDHGADRAGRRPARALRPAGQRLRDALPRPGQPGRRRARAPARHHDPARAPRTARARRSSRASCTSASRCAWSSSSRARSRVSAQVTRNEADQLELAEGATVWVRTAEARPPFPP